MISDEITRYLSDRARWSLTSSLDKHGWPSHLRKMDTANWQLAPNMPWEPADKEVLKLLSAHGVKTKDIAEVFFEGRTEQECQSALSDLETNASTVTVEDRRAPAPPITRPPNTILSPSATNDLTVLPVPPARTSIPTPSKKQLSGIFPANCTEPSRDRHQTPYADSQKTWEQVDRDIIWEAMKKNMTPRQIQEQYLPSRSESAIQTRISKERKLRSALNAPTTPTVPTKRSPDELGEETDKLGWQDIQIPEEKDDDSDYVEEVSPKEKHGVARTPITPSDMAQTKKAPSISSIRTKLINSIDSRILSKDKKIELKKALKNNWPTHFASVEGHNAPPKKGAQWSENDIRTLKIIHETVPELPYRYVANFFPGRNEAGISRQINSKIKSSQ